MHPHKLKVQRERERNEKDERKENIKKKKKTTEKKKREREREAWRTTRSGRGERGGEVLPAASARGAPRGVPKIQRTNTNTHLQKEKEVE